MKHIDFLSKIMSRRPRGAIVELYCLSDSLASLTIKKQHIMLLCDGSALYKKDYTTNESFTTYKDANVLLHEVNLFA